MQLGGKGARGGPVLKAPKTVVLSSHLKLKAQKKLWASLCFTHSQGASFMRLLLPEKRIYTPPHPGWGGPRCLDFPCILLMGVRLAAKHR